MFNQPTNRCPRSDRPAELHHPADLNILGGKANTSVMTSHVKPTEVAYYGWPPAGRDRLITIRVGEGPLPAPTNLPACLHHSATECSTTSLREGSEGREGREGSEGRERGKEGGREEPWLVCWKNRRDKWSPESSGEERDRSGREE